jgi:hypothetical protein
MERCRYVAKLRFHVQFSASRGGWVLWDILLDLRGGQDCPCSRICNCALCNSGCSMRLARSRRQWVSDPTYHCGKFSSHRICLRLQVLQPFLDLVWLLRGGPPPGPAIIRGTDGFILLAAVAALFPLQIWSQAMTDSDGSIGSDWIGPLEGFRSSRGLLLLGSLACLCPS